MRTVLTGIVAVIVVSALALTIWWTLRSDASPGEISTYEVLNTINYHEGMQSFRTQTAGILTLSRQSRQNNEVAYHYTFSSKVQSPESAGSVEVKFPPVEILRDCNTDRFVGGHPLLKNLAVVSNDALYQVKHQLAIDTPVQIRSFDLPAIQGFPKKLTYHLEAKSQQILAVGRAVLVLARSEPFEFADPVSAAPIVGQHQVLLLTDAKMDRVISYVMRFAAMPASSKTDTIPFTVEMVLQQLIEGKPVSIRGIDATFDHWLEEMNLATAEDKAKTNASLPLWAMHSLAVRDEVELVAGAAIEGKPNFVITATIGTILLIDSGVSVGTKLLHETGVIDWEWKGIPNYAGGGLGLMAAKGFSAITAQPVDESRWRAAGGIAGDLGAVFLPSSVTGVGARITLGGTEAGIEIIKTGSLAGKAIRISEDGVELVKAQKGWLASADVSEKLLVGKKLLSLSNAVKAAGELQQQRASVAATGQPMPSTKNIAKGRTKVNRSKSNAVTAVNLGDGVKLELVRIWPGTFTMGAPDTEFRRDSNETQHEVTLTKGYFIGKYEVTQAQWRKIMSNNPSPIKGDELPVENVTWKEAVAYCEQLSQKVGRKFRLPTEAEWEYACRAGTNTSCNIGESETYMLKAGWFQANAGKLAHPVGQLQPNAWGIYDMHGNVSEWCNDIHCDYPKRAVVDPQGAEKGSSRILRGGSYNADYRACRAAFRNWFFQAESDRGIGFRLVMDLDGEEEVIAGKARSKKPLLARDPVVLPDGLIEVNEGIITSKRAMYVIEVYDGTGQGQAGSGTQLDLRDDKSDLMVIFDGSFSFNNKRPTGRSKSDYETRGKAYILVDRKYLDRASEPTAYWELISTPTNPYHWEKSGLNGDFHSRKQLEFHPTNIDGVFCDVVEFQGRTTTPSFMDNDLVVLDLRGRGMQIFPFSLNAHKAGDSIFYQR